MKSLGLCCVLMVLTATLFAGKVQYGCHAAGNVLQREQTGTAGSTSYATTRLLTYDLADQLLAATTDELGATESIAYNFSRLPSEAIRPLGSGSSTITRLNNFGLKK